MSGVLACCDKNEDKVVLANEQTNLAAKNQILISRSANFDAGSITLEWLGDPKMARAAYTSDDLNFNTPVSKFERGGYSNSLSIIAIDTIS